MEKETNIFNININTELPIEELNYIHKILLCLENTYKSPDKEIRKKSEEFLKEVEQNLFSHLIQIFNFIKKNTISKELNNAFIIFIRNSIINKKNSNLLSKENYIELIMLIINIIVDPEYPSQCLREMNKIFEEIIDNKEFIKDKTFMKNFINLFASKLKIGLIQVHSYKSIAYIFENILGSNCIDESNCQYFVDIVLNCTEEMLNKIINILGEIDINKIGNNNIEIQNNIQYYLETVKIIYELVLLISIMTQNQFNNFDKFSDKLMNYFFDTGIKMLTINYTQLYEAIMKMKTKILRYINSIVLNIPLKISSKDKKMIDQHKNLITFCIESLKSQNFFIFNNDNSAQKSLIEKFDIQIIIYLYKSVNLGGNLICNSVAAERSKHIVAFENKCAPLVVPRAHECFLRNGAEGVQHRVQDAGNDAVGAGRLPVVRLLRVGRSSAQRAKHSRQNVLGGCRSGSTSRIRRTGSG